MKEKSLTQWLPKLGLAEGSSTLLLFGAAMPLKYFGGLPIAVSIVGMLHGVLFLGLIFVLFLAIRAQYLSPRMGLLGMVSAIVPFGPFLFHHALPGAAKTLSKKLRRVLGDGSLVAAGATALLSQASSPSDDSLFVQVSLIWTVGALACGLFLAFAPKKPRLVGGILFLVLSLPYFELVFRMITHR